MNGQSLGTKKRDPQDFPAAGLRWDVKFREGEDRLRAVGHHGSATVTDEIPVAYQTQKWEKPARFDLRQMSRGAKTVTVEARLLDRNGVLCLDAKPVVRFSIAGQGTLIDNLGTSTARALEMYNGRAIISVARNGGPSTVSVTTKGLPASFVQLT